MESNTHSTNNYLYYVIEDIEDNVKKVRGHVIGVQHWVEPKDQDLNPRILEAINHSAQVILEIPPNAPPPLLPSEEDSKSFKNIIYKAITDLKFSPNSETSADPISLETEIEQLLKEIESKGLKAGDKNHEGYEEIKKVLIELPSSEEKLKFLKAIQKNIFDFNLISFERNINKRVVEAKKTIKPLEEGNLNEKLLEANLKVGLRKIKEKILSEAEYQEVVKEVNKIESSEEKLEFVDKQKSQLGIKDIDVPISDEEVQALKEALYRAWVDGDAEKLRELLEVCFKIFKEEPEVDQVHQSRDKQMADRIIKVVTKAKEKDTEVTIMMGSAHLIYTKRTNIIDYLNQRFNSDLRGWSIRQIIKSDTL
jgi:hypothetical protein